MTKKKRFKGAAELKRLEIRLESEKRRLERKLKAFGQASLEAKKQKERLARVQAQLKKLR